MVFPAHDHDACESAFLQWTVWPFFCPWNPREGRSARRECSSVSSAVGVAGAAANRKGLTDYPSAGNARIIERVPSSHQGERTLRIATWLMQSKDSPKCPDDCRARSN